MESDFFYQDDYEQGFTTNCPPLADLAKLKQCSFANTGKDYSSYVAVLHAIQLDTGCTIFDFGCSWGYGSWQLRQAGYRVYSFEVSRTRARYAVENLQCEFCPPHDLTQKVDCFFSAHVIEHLPDPRALWEIARDLVKPSGTVVLFLPNGEPSREPIHPHYHRLWGQVHPVMLSPRALTLMGEQYGFVVRCYSSPYSMQEIGMRQQGSVMGDELLVVASPRSSSAQ